MNEWTRETLNVMGLMSGATVALGVTTALGYWVGHRAGVRWGFEPWGTTAGVLLGLGVGFVQIWGIYRRFLRR
ncbi:MAG: AtpZ/AtpI family protein [Planctomycetes bacterium]|nr:AtpZ/AtpI family protein [Planctomycetota bacterium]